MEDLLPAVKDDEEFFFGHACSTLEKHHENMPRARVFAHALFAASTPEQWSSRKEIVKSSLSDTTWAEIEGLTEGWNQNIVFYNAFVVEGNKTK